MKSKLLARIVGINRGLTEDEVVVSKELSPSMRVVGRGTLVVDFEDIKNEYNTMVYKIRKILQKKLK